MNTIKEILAYFLLGIPFIFLLFILIIMIIKVNKINSFASMLLPSFYSPSPSHLPLKLSPLTLSADRFSD